VSACSTRSAGWCRRPGLNRDDLSIAGSQPAAYACSATTTWSTREESNFHGRDSPARSERAASAVPPPVVVPSLALRGARSANRTQSCRSVKAVTSHLSHLALRAPPRSRALLRGLIRPGHVTHVAVQRSAARVSNPSARLIRSGSSLEVGGKNRTAPRNRTELQCFVRAGPAPAGERRVALGRGFEPR
jgi:hypothetical protein